MMHTGRRRGWSMALAVVVLKFFFGVLSVFVSFLSSLCVRRISMPWRWRMTRET